MKFTTTLKRAALVATIAAPWSFSSLQSDAATYTYNILAGTSSWNANASWDPNTGFANAVGDRATLTSNFTATSTINLNQLITIGRLDIGDSTNTFRAITIAPAGGSLTFDNTGTTNAIISKPNTVSTVTDTISAPVTLNDSLNVTNAAANAPIVISGTITEFGGTMSLTKLGVGTLTLSGAANNYTGITTVSAGTLAITAPTSLYNGNGAGGWTSTNIIVNANAMLNLSYGGSGFTEAEITTLSALTGYANGAFLGLNTTAGDATLTSNVNNANVILTKTGTNKLTLTGTNNVKTAVQAGTVQFTNTNTLFAGNAANWTSTNFGVSAGAAAVFNVGGVGEFTPSDISTLSAVGTATGGFLLGSSIGIDTTNAVGNTTIATVIANPNAGANTLGLRKLGNNTLVLAAANTYSGPTTLEAGGLILADSNAVQTSVYSNTGGTFAFSSSVGSHAFTIGGLGGSTQIDLLDDALNTVNLTIGNRSATFSGTLAGNGNLTKTGGGTQTFTGTNTFTGTTTINSGAVIYNSDAAIGGTAGPIVTVNAGGTASASYSLGIDQTFLGRIVNTSTGVVGVSSASASSLDFSAATGANMASISLGSTGVFTYTGVITPFNNVYRLGGGTSAGNLTIGTPLSAGNSLILDINGTNAASTVTLNQANGHDLGTTLNAGTVAVANDAAFGTGSITLVGGKILSSGAANYIIPNSIVANGSTKISAITSQSLTFTGSITGTGTLSIDSDSVSGLTGSTSINGDLTNFHGTIDFVATPVAPITGVGVGGNAAGNGLLMNRLSVAGVNDYSTVKFVLHGDTNNASNGRSLRPGDTGTIGANIVKMGELSGDGGLLVAPSYTSMADPTNIHIYEVGYLNTDSTYAGGFRELGSMQYVKVGTGKSTLSGKGVQSGATTIRSGSLILAGNTSISNLWGNGNNLTNDGLFLNSFATDTATDRFTADAATIAANAIETVGVMDTLANGTPVILGGTSALGLAAGATTYYVVNSTGVGTTQSFQLALTPGGASLNIGTIASGVRVYPFGSTGIGSTALELGDTGLVNGHTATTGSETVSLLTGAAVTINRQINVNNVGAGSTIGGTDHNSTFSGAIVLAKDVNLTSATTGSNAVTFSGMISGTGFGINKVNSGTVVLTGGNTYSGATTISAGTLQVGNGGTTGSLGSGSITDNGTLAFNRSDAVNVSTGITGSGNLQQIGAGTTTLTGANTYTGNTTVSGGSLNVATTGSITSPAGNLSVGDGAFVLGGSASVQNTVNTAGTGTIHVQSTGSLTANNLLADFATIDGVATVRANGGVAGASKVETFNISTAGKLDLKDNDLVVGSAANVTAVRDQIKLGKTNNAPSGITSDAALFGSKTGFGYAMGDDPNLSPLLTNSSLLTGQSFDADSVLVKYTFLGDADLDGDTDLNDLGKWASNFTGDLNNPAVPAKFWTQGDFDYDGDTDLNDLGKWSSNFTGDLNGGAGSLIVYAPGASASAVAVLNGMGITVVPEPSTFVLAGVGLAGLAIASRRKRRA